MKRTRLPLLLLSLAPLLFAHCTSGEDEAPHEQKPRPVQFERVAGDAIRLSSTYQGNTRAEVETSLSFRTSGRVKRVAMEVGDRVRKGQLLAVVETTDQQLQVEQQRAQRGQLVARVELARSQYERAQRLFESGSASASDLEVARTELESARASLRSLDQQIQLLQRQVSYGRLEAPSDGAIAEVMIEVGENVQAGAPVARLESEESGGIEVQVSVPEGDIGQLARGDEAIVTISAIPNREFTARVTEVGVSSTSGGGTFPVTLKLVGDTGSVRPGMTATARFTRSSESDPGAKASYYVDPDAVVEGQDGRFVWIAVPTGDDRATVEKRPVTTGELHADRYEITSGLNDGDRVVTAGLRFLEKGQPVRLLAKFDRTPERVKQILDASGDGSAHGVSTGEAGSEPGEPGLTDRGDAENTPDTNGQPTERGAAR